MRTPTARAKIRQERILLYFIEATDNIIREEGISGVTIRKAADLAGYTSATLYNYFDDLSHLIFLATVTHLEPYYKALIKYTKWCTNSIERYMATTECFCKYAFEEPEVYDLLFFKHTDEKLERYTLQYYELFPEKKVIDTNSSLSRFFHINSIQTRSQIQLDECVTEGFMHQKPSEDFNTIILMISQCLLEKVRLGAMSAEEATIRMIRYYCQMFYAYCPPNRLEDITRSVEVLASRCPDFLKEAYAVPPPCRAEA